MSRVSGRLLVLLAALTLAPAARAHDGHHPKTLRMLLKPDGLIVSVRLDYPAGQDARQARIAWDENGDGRIDPGECERALDMVGQRSIESLVVERDQVRLQPAALRRDALGWVGPVASAEPLSASFQYCFAFFPHPGRHRLVVRDQPGGGLHHVPAQIQAGKGVRLVLPQAVPDHQNSLQMLSLLVTREAGLDVLFEVSAVAATGRSAP